MVQDTETSLSIQENRHDVFEHFAAKEGGRIDTRLGVNQFGCVYWEEQSYENRWNIHILGGVEVVAVAVCAGHDSWPYVVF